MRFKLVAAAFGMLFGFMISWGHFTDPDEIRQMLLVEDLYLWKMFATAVAVAYVGARLWRASHSWLGGEPISWITLPPARRHVTGSMVFGVGWAVAASCPAPIAAQLPQGVWWSLFTIAGVGAGVLVYLRREERAGTAHVEAGPDTPASVRGNEAARTAVAVTATSA